MKGIAHRTQRGCPQGIPAVGESGHSWSVLIVSRLLDRGASAVEVQRVRSTATKVRHGVYTPALADEWAVYDLKCSAVLDALQGCVLAGPSAAHHWGLPLVGPPPSRVFVRGVTRGSYGSDVKVVSGGDAQWTDDRGTRVVTAEWAVADCARILPRRDALIVADAALHLGKCTAADLQVVIGVLGRAKDIGRVRWISANADGRSESPGETWTRMVVKDLGYEVECQFTVIDGTDRRRIDLLIAGTKVGLEFDGLLKYGEQHLDEEEAKLKITEEKRRQGGLEALGYHILRLIWEQLFDPATVDRRIAYALHGQVPRRLVPAQMPPGW